MTKVLIVIDPREETHSALERCKEISTDADLQLHVCMFVDAASASELASTLKNKTSWLGEQTKPYVDLGYKITTEVTSFARLHESIIQIALKVKADLIFKPMRQHSIVRRVVLTSTDWNLIRFCPTPVLLVSDKEIVRGKPVIAAIDVCNEDEKHSDLNHIVLDQATRVAAVLDSQVHSVNAWSVTSSVMAAGSVDPTPYDLAHAKKSDHLEESKSLCEEHGISTDNIIVEEGTAEFVINTAATELDAGVLVLGTVARSGISGLFVGNTAEAVLEGSATDILVVKQADFECPLDL